MRMGMGMGMGMGRGWGTGKWGKKQELYSLVSVVLSRLNQSPNGLPVAQRWFTTGCVRHARLVEHFRRMLKGV